MGKRLVNDLAEFFLSFKLGSQNVIAGTLSRSTSKRVLLEYMQTCIKTVLEE